MIGIIDYKMGNIGSIQNMLKRISVKSVISSKIEILNNCDKLILPGVGSFDQGMKNLKNHNFIRFLNDYVIKDKKPILGICLGMQLFADNSEEGDLSGLGWIKGNVKKFNLRKDGLKVPHMGWNNIECKNSKLFLNLPNEKRFYFVHSFFFECKNKENIISTTDYGINFASSINKQNIWGTQFHPEKSHICGMNLLKNYAKL
tara:strand:+ start:827 stop:1432 length:606 start_codon:yes stop_codon:yes gene_type:complete